MRQAHALRSKFLQQLGDVQKPGLHIGGQCDEFWLGLRV